MLSSPFQPTWRCRSPPRPKALADLDGPRAATARRAGADGSPNYIAAPPLRQSKVVADLIVCISRPADHDDAVRCRRRTRRRGRGGGRAQGLQRVRNRRQLAPGVEPEVRRLGCSRRGVRRPPRARRRRWLPPRGGALSSPIIPPAVLRGAPGAPASASTTVVAACFRGRTPGLPPRGVRPRLAASAQRGSFRSTCGTSLRKARLELETRNSRGRTARLPRRSGHDRAGSLKSGVSRLLLTGSEGERPAGRFPAVHRRRGYAEQAGELGDRESALVA